MATTASTRVPPARRRVLHAGSAGMIVGGLLLVIGSLLPWATTPLVSVSGTAGPGLWTLSAGFIAIAGGVLPYRKLAIGHCLLAGAGAALVVLVEAVGVIHLSATTGAWGQILPGMGMVMASGGAVVLLRTGYRLVRTT